MSVDVLGRERTLIATHNWLDFSSFAGLFIFRGSAPPPSRKFTDTPELPPRLVVLSVPSKNGRRLTSVPLNVPLARMPGTTTPTLGCVSVHVSVSGEPRSSLMLGTHSCR